MWLVLLSGCGKLIRPKNIMGSDPVSQVYEHFLLLDFEATCEEGRKIQPIQVSAVLNAFFLILLQV